jgi:uncharacterized protein YggE
MKRAAIAFLLLTGCSDSNSALGLPNDEVLLQVSATGKAEAAPDEALLTLGVSTGGGTAAAASAENSVVMARVTDALRALGITAENIQTRSITLNRIDYGPERGRYQAANVAEVRIRDVAKAGPAIAAATEAGGNVVSGPDLRVADPSATDNLAYAAAYRAARRRAEAYAEAADLRVRRVLAIRDGATSVSPIYNMRQGREAAVQTVAPPPVVMQGVSTREVQVHVDFALGR